MTNKHFEVISNFKVKASDDGKDTIKIEGYANTTTTDRSGDIIIEEAWSKGGMDNYLKNPIVLAYHKHDQPIGEVTGYGVSNKGLHVVAEISKAAGDVYDLVKDGILKAFSVGFRVKDAEYDVDTDLFVIKDLELYEISVVSIPANAESLFSVAKSFTTEEDCLEYKKSFNISQNEADNSQAETDNIGDTKVTEKKKEEVSLTPEQLAKITADAATKAVAEALANKAAEEAKEKAALEAAEKVKLAAISAGESGAERLIKEVEERFAATTKTQEDALEGLRTELAEKNAEILAVQSGKMSFEDKGAAKANVTNKQVDNAVLLAKIMGKSVDQTKFGANLIEKASVGAHLASMTSDWEADFSTRMMEGIKDKLVLEPLFTNRIDMTARTMNFPYNPEAGYAGWIATANLRSNNLGSSASSSTGENVDHLLTEISITADKLAAKEYLGYEEEEDSILPILSIIQGAAERRMARTIDTEILRANAGAETVSGTGTAPTTFNGICVIADDVAGAAMEIAQATTGVTSVADLQTMRRNMGVWGLQPSELVYIVNQKTYFDLLEDPDFRTMDLVGANATILSGQIGSCNGSPVIVSDSFDTVASSAYGAVCVNVRNFLYGTLRGLTVERDRNIEDQKNIIVVTKRIGFTPITAATATQSATSVLKYS